MVTVRTWPEVRKWCGPIACHAPLQATSPMQGPHATLQRPAGASNEIGECLRLKQATRRQGAQTDPFSLLTQSCTQPGAHLTYLCPYAYPSCDPCRAPGPAHAQERAPGHVP